MAYFPLFMNLEGKKVLLIGGKKEALHKIKKLEPFGVQITVIAPEYLPELECYPLVEIKNRCFQETDLEEEWAFVISAVGDATFHQWLRGLCQSRKLLFNAADDPKNCDILFPALVTKGKLSVGICTEGASPTVAIELKKQIETMVPDTIDEILQYLDEQRPWVMEQKNTFAERAALRRRLYQACMQRGRKLTKEERDMCQREGSN